MRRSSYGCRVTTTTISREQHALARERVAAAGLGDRVTVLLQDYRDLARQLRQAGVDRDDRGRSGISISTPISANARACSTPDGADAAAGDHDRGPSLRARAPVGRFHQALHVPGQLHPVGGALMRDAIARVKRPALCSTSRTSGRTTRRRSRAGARTCSRNLDARARARLSRAIHAHVGVLLCYCEGGFAERAHRRRADAAREAPGAVGRTHCSDNWRLKPGETCPSNHFPPSARRTGDGMVSGPDPAPLPRKRVAVCLTGTCAA